ncbi:MAG: CoA-binding protein [Candidatus Jordarchaeales archaeon]
MDLRRMFEPKSIAVVGVSENFLNPGTVIFRKNLHEMEVNTFGVNPKGGVMDGREIYRKVSDIPVDLDLVVIAIRAEYVNPVVEECGEIGVGGVVVISGGFAEAGGAGIERQRELTRIALKYDLPVIGPNCFGIYSPPYVDTFFLPSERMVKLPPGNIAIISQSGGFMVDHFFSRFYERNLGISIAVGVGNKAVVDEAMILNYLEKDPRTKTVTFYIEGFREGEGARFLEAARSCAEKKTVVVFRAGKTETAKRTVASHTGLMATSPKLFSAALKQNGIIEAQSEDEIISFAKVFSFNLKPIERGNVAIVTISGGHGVVCSDLCAEAGLKLVELTEEEQQELRSRLKPSAAYVATLKNPIDLTGSATDDDMEATLNFLLEKEDVDAVIILTFPYPPALSLTLGRRLSNIAVLYDKPVVAHVPWLPKYSMIVEGFEYNGVPVAHTIAEVVQMVKALYIKGQLLKAARKRTLEAVMETPSKQCGE